ECGVSVRTIQNYESGKMLPRRTGIYATFARIFEVSSDYLLAVESDYLYTKEERTADELLIEIGNLFASDDLTEDEKEIFVRKINELYWQARDNNRKYTPHRFRSNRP
ncbi:MAG: helix-turn-helix transcriptional regulator, partial [Clostridiaceae bacterium]|nr:helix-turn-helix transcriptional regulator [Clostridiaceae bacterium]